MDDLNRVQVYPVTPERWADIESLFGVRGACANCWCMYWRLPHKEYEAMRQDQSTRTAFKGIVESGSEPGLIAYQNDQPVGWVCIGPREEFQTLQRSRVLKPLDDKPVWSVVCFFVARKLRRQGITVDLLRAAVQYAGAHGAKIVEGYPVQTPDDHSPDAFVYTGLPGAFLKVGFVEAGRNATRRPIFRYEIK